MSPQADARIRWRALGALFLAGGAVALSTLVAGVDATVHREAILALAVIAVLCGALFTAAAARLPESGMGIGLTLGALLVSAAVVASGEADTPYVLLYVWICAEGWYFLLPRRALTVSLFTLVASGGSMAAVMDGDVDTLAWWLTIASTLAVVGVLAAALRMRSERLIATLSEAADRDPLTGLYNRRGYRRAIERELARARRDGTEVSVVLGDIDGFKALNDRLGHLEGDRVLSAFAEVCLAGIRGTDLACRVGGEEFVLVLPATGTPAALHVTERLREGVVRRVVLEGAEPVTASFGVATFPRDGLEPDALLHHADQAMYEAKRRGRDQVVAFCRLGGRAGAGAAPGVVTAPSPRT